MYACLCLREHIYFGACVRMPVCVNAYIHKHNSKSSITVLCLKDPAAPSRSFRQRVRRLPLPHVRLPHRTTRGVHPPRQLQPESGVDTGWGTRHAVDAEEAHDLR